MNSRFRFLDDYLQTQLARLNIPGAALAIVEGEETVHLRTFGAARPGGAAPTARTPFFIGSLTKSITALAVMQLVEAGQIELDAPVCRYLPWFALADPEASAQMTVRHLLNQTSGLSQTIGMTPLADFDERPDAVERQARKLATFRPARPPGAAWEYSNMNYNLLGLIIEAVSGEPYTAYVQRRIFAPLDMQHSHTEKSAAQQDGLAVGHRSWFGVPVAASDLPVPHGSLPSGQLMASVEDMAHYLVAHMNEGCYGAARVLSREGMAELHRPAVTAASMGVDIGAYGMGWFVGETPAGPRIWHNGQVPDYFAYMAFLPELRRGIVLLVNTNQMMLNFALMKVAESAADMLAGSRPASVPWRAIPWVLRGALLIPLLQVADVAITLRATRRWQAEPGRRPTPLRLWLLAVLPLTLFNVMLAAPAIGLLATRLRKFLRLFMPDLFWLGVLCGGFSLLWAFVRARLLLRAKP